MARLDETSYGPSAAGCAGSASVALTPTMATLPIAPAVRRLIHVKGIVQGVGFRPFVYALAQSLSLTGAVFNTSAGVTIEIEGELAAVDCWSFRLRDRTSW